MPALWSDATMHNNRHKNTIAGGAKKRPESARCENLGATEANPNIRQILSRFQSKRFCHVIHVNSAPLLHTLHANSHSLAIQHTHVAQTAADGIHCEDKHRSPANSCGRQDRQDIRRQAAPRGTAAQPSELQQHDSAQAAHFNHCQRRKQQAGQPRSFQ